MGTGNNSRMFSASSPGLMEATQVSGSNAVGPSASATVEDEAVPGHSFLAMLRCSQPAPKYILCRVARVWV